MLSNLRRHGTTLSFKRSMGPDQELSYTGVVKGDKIEGTFAGPFGELESNGERRTKS